MRIALLGYGKMGKTIEKIALERGHSISFAINIDNAEQINEINPDNTDVSIEFSQPESAVANIKAMLKAQVPVVVGTTGWLEHKAEVESFCKQHKSTLLFSSNFSIGVNLFFKLNSMLAEIMKPYPDYKVEIEEVHHTEKKDAPSGTAITLAEGILKSYQNKQSWVNHSTSEDHHLGIISKRIDAVPGTHTIRYHSSIDGIEITHTAHSREGFAIGAVVVAEWIQGKKGLYTMNDFLGF